MATVSGVSTSGVYANNVAATSASVAASPSAQLAASQALVTSTLVSLGNGPSSVLTYNAAGLLNSFQQVTANKSTATTGSAQTAQNAILAAQNAITQTLGSLVSNPSSNTNSSSSDIYSLFSLTGTAGSNNSSGLVQGPLLNTSSTGNANVKAAQNAYLVAQYAVTQALTSIVSSASLIPSNSRI
jgi:hypothetical protein